MMFGAGILSQCGNKGLIKSYRRFGKAKNMLKVPYRAVRTSFLIGMMIWAAFTVSFIVAQITAPVSESVLPSSTTPTLTPEQPGTPVTTISPTPAGTMQPVTQQPSLPTPSATNIPTDAIASVAPSSTGTSAPKAPTSLSGIPATQQSTLSPSTKQQTTELSPSKSEHVNDSAQQSTDPFPVWKIALIAGGGITGLLVVAILCWCILRRQQDAAYEETLAELDSRNAYQLCTSQTAKPCHDQLLSFNPQNSGGALVEKGQGHQEGLGGAGPTQGALPLRYGLYHPPQLSAGVQNRSVPQGRSNI